MSYHDSINDMPKKKKRGNWKISRKLNTWKVIDKHFVMGILISDSIKKKNHLKKGQIVLIFAVCREEGQHIKGTACWTVTNTSEIGALINLNRYTHYEIVIVSLQTLVEPKLSQMILDKKFHGEYTWCNQYLIPIALKKVVHASSA